MHATPKTAPETIAAWLAESSRAVAFTGAGISTESGIPDFRSPGGVWAKYSPVYYDDFLSSATARHEYWRQKSEAHPEMARAEPNAGHRTLAAWEASGRIAGVITQNIDELHQRAGSRNVWELHGTAMKIACTDCSARYEAGPLVARFVETDEVPLCEKCGGARLKHATISFGQTLLPEVLNGCAELARAADLFFAIGSSLVVEPAASLPRLAADSGGKLVIVNRDETPLDGLAASVIRAPIGETLSAIDAVLARRRENP